MNRSEKFRELLEREKYLFNQLNDCETAQYKMLRKAFSGLGLKVGSIFEMSRDKSYASLSEITEWSVRYWRKKDGQSNELCEISFEDLFDAEVQE